jgi:hypothetical protein
VKKYFQILALAGSALFAAHAPAQTLDFTLSASSSDGKTVTPKLTWATTPAATSCTASGDAAWAGTKAASGTATLAGVATSKTYILNCAWPGSVTAIVSWVPPTTNADGTAYTDPNGFRIQWGNVGPADQQLDHTTYLSNAQSVGNTWTSPALSPDGTWYFGIKAVNSAGLESLLSNVTSKVITASASQSRTLVLAVKFPNPPVVTIQ